MTNFYTIDHARITGYLRNYDPVKQYFRLLPFNDTSRTSPEYLIQFDDFLLPCNIPTQIAKPLIVIKHLVYSPLDDKDKSYYTAVSNIRIHVMNCSSFLPKSFLTWYKQNKKLNINLLLNMHPLFEILPKIFNEYSTIVHTNSYI